MSKSVYFLNQAALLETLPPGADEFGTYRTFNGFNLGAPFRLYYSTSGNSFPNDIDFVRMDVVQMTFTRPTVYGTGANAGTIATEKGNQIYQLWEAATVPDNFVIPGSGTKDLSVKLNSVTPTTLESNGSITLDFDVKNNGTEAAGASNLGIYLSIDSIIDKNDTLLGSFQQVAIGAKQTSEWYNVTSPPLSLPGGTHYIGIIVDKDGAIAESNEGNNVSNAIKLTSKAATAPDLKVSLGKVTPTSVASDGSLHIEYSLTNSGDTTASAPATVFYLSKDATIDKNDLFLGSVTLDLFGKSTHADSDNFGLFDAFPAGKYYLGAIIDRDETIQESNEANNVSKAIAITITGENAAPDAINDNVTTNYETPIKIDVLANDTDPNPGDKLRFELGFNPDAAVPDPGAPKHGKVTVNADKTITYTPDQSFFGKDSFTYRLFDNLGSKAVDSGFVNVTVGFEDVVENKKVIAARERPYDWDFEIPEGAQGTYRFDFEISKPTTLYALVTSEGEDSNPVQFHPELIAHLGNKAPTLGPGPDRIGRGDKGYLNADETAQVFEDPLMPGKYSFEILRQPNDTGPAEGNIKLYLSPDEAGNRIEWAAPARIGTAIKGVVDRVDNKDIYKFTLKEQSSVAVSLAVAGLTNKADGVPALHYEIMTNAGSTDFYHVLDSHMATSIFIDTAYTEPDLNDVANTPLDAGEYYVIIYHSADTPFSEDTKDERHYSLKINAWADHAANRPLITDFGAEGPKSANIGDLTNKSYANRDFLGLADGNDFYMFSLSERSTVKMALTQPSKDVSMDLEFSSMSGGNISAQLIDAVGDGAGPRTIVATLDAGTYMLRAHTDTEFGNKTASDGYGSTLVLPHKGGSTYDLKIASSTTLSKLENGTTGIDNYLGSFGEDKFNGKAGDDWLQGKGGNDNLLGDLGKDRIDGGEGDDFIVGGLSADTLTGGSGSDTFTYLKPSEGGDTIVDFSPGQDKIGLVKASFAMTKVALNATDPNYDFALHYFVSGAGAAATEAHGQLLFDTGSHNLYWDANGKAAGGVTLLATFSNGASPTVGDFDLL